MNIKQLVAAATVLAATGAAFAEARYPVDTPFVSTKTRAEVRAELEQARAQGLLTWGESRNYPVSAPVRSTRSREEVRAEAIEAMKHPQRNR